LLLTALNYSYTKVLRKLGRLILSLEDTTYYEEYASIAYGYAKTNFSIEKMQFEYEQIYKI
ncbi:hypothetical protein GAQ43_16660, partial [Bacteroides uniformis]